VKAWPLVREFHSPIVRIRRSNWCRLLILFAFASAIGSTSGNVAFAQEGDELAGRLGGTLASFDATFDRTSESRAADSISFVGPGQSSLFAQFTGGKVPLSDDLAYFILIRSPRSPHLSALAPSDADWTVDAALALGMSFLPLDVKRDPLAATSDQELEASCSSDILAETLGASEDGSCQIRLLLSGKDSVSYVTLTATNGDISASTANPCEGLAAWSEATASRLDKVHAILDTTSQANQADPWAPQRLRQFSVVLDKLATEQSTSEAPLSVAWPSDLFTGAFSAYSSALRQVSAGLASTNLKAINSAIDVMNGASADIDHAKSLLEPPLASCGLSSA
jgi:hypothetical protein